MTQLIATNEFDELAGLLSKRARQKLREDVEKNWPDVKRNNIALDLEDIIDSFPVKLLRHTVAYEKYCDIDVVVPAVKRVSVSSGDGGGAKERAVFVQVRARFFREYTQGKLPEWTITRFEVEDFRVEDADATEDKS